MWLIVTTGAQLVRQPGVPSWDSVWQEHGSIFLSDAMYQSFPRALVHAYNAYLHVVPRMVASLAAAVPLNRAALVLATSSAVVVALLSVYVYFASATLLRSQWARVVLAAMFVLLPATAYETTANVANLHWYLLFACFSVFLHRPKSWSGIVVATAVAGAAVLSDPLAGLFLPLAALAIYDRATPRQLIVPIVFLVALGIQLTLGALAKSPAPYMPTHLFDIPGIFALRVTGSFLIGDRYLPAAWASLRWWFAGASVAVVAAFMVYGLVTARMTSRFYILVWLVYSCAFLAVPLTLRGTEDYLDGAGFVLNGSRYMVLPIWFLIVATLVVLDRPRQVRGEMNWRRVQCAFVLYVAALAVVNFSDTSVRTAGPGWHGQLDVAREQCARGQHVDPANPGVQGEVLARVDQYRPDVLVPIAPNVEPHPWVVPITCARLR